MAELVGSSPKNYIVYIRSNYYNNKKPNVAPQLGSRESSLYVDRPSARLMDKMNLGLTQPKN